MLYRVFSFLIMAMCIGACAKNSFSNSSAGTPTELDSGSSTPETDIAGLPQNGSGSQFIADGQYYSLAYKTACADNGAISVILVSNSSSQAVMTRQGCVNLAVPITLNIQNIQGMVGGLISLEGELFIRNSN